MAHTEFIAAARESLEAIERARAAGRILVSDVTDADGHQYIDLVLEGGGVLGIALVGYLFALERAGLRFLSIGGTSAGSIVALLAAAAGGPASERATRLIDIVADMPIARFQDGDGDAQAFIDWLLKDSGKLFQPGISFSEIGAWVSGASKVVQVRDNFVDDLGLCPGSVFESWVTDRLHDFGVDDTAGLIARMQPGAGQLGYAGGEEGGAQRVSEARARLCLVAADLTTERKVSFPEDAPLYYAEPDGVAPAEFVRASMSVPFFFHPKRCRVPRTPQAEAAWDARIRDGRARALRYHNAWPPTECLMVDGGVMSNFPIDAFHAVGRVPTRPTLGVKLAVSPPYTAIGTPLALLSQLFNGARHCRDNDFIAGNPDFDQLVQTIDTGGQGWLDFKIARQAQADLFARGVRAAHDFLCGHEGTAGFDWPNYKEIRRALAQASQAVASRSARA
ncbi:MAG: patatin-like phospholipase family protein [Rhodocyclaceae bacterium]|nr:patatin-like phospholipase family protein [Rhodocyclaceae bacterium]